MGDDQCRIRSYDLLRSAHGPGLRPLSFLGSVVGGCPDCRRRIAALADLALEPAKRTPHPVSAPAGLARSVGVRRSKHFTFPFRLRRSASSLAPLDFRHMPVGTYRPKVALDARGPFRILPVLP